MELESSQSYANFRAWCPRKEVSIGVMHPVNWRYYDWGPRDYPEPILCLHDLIGSAECFFQQIISIAPRGYRIIAVQIPVYWTVAEFCDGFHNFLETIPHRRLHLYGAGLGGFLAMHYAVRKPERVASLILTHSFLTTDGLKLLIPYSSAVLRWVPDFLLRANYRALMPKGRVPLDLANAAELAIGHTMSRPREELASRLALYVNDSSVVNRLHIPQSSITLIDTLDRQPTKVELSQRTVGHLPNARRAFIKTGGDFPYIAGPDEVNVHLIVHLRRNAPSPAVDLPVPAPAKPMVLPLSARRRREIEEAQRRAREAQAKQENDAKKESSRTRRSPDELLVAARAMVEAEERRMVEFYGFEISRLREFLPERRDPYLSAVIGDCEGNLEVAIARVLDNHYGDLFYDDSVNQAVQKTVQDLQRAEEEETVSDDGAEPDKGTSIETGEKVDEANGSICVGGGLLGTAELSKGCEEDVSDDRATRSALSQDPLGETEFPPNNMVRNAFEASETAIGNEKNSTDADCAMPVSPGTKSSEPDSESAETHGNAPFSELQAATSPRSALASIDLGAKAFYGDANGQESPENKTLSEGMQSAKKLESNSGHKRSRRSRRKSFPQTGDSVDDYVSSEKVGMRSSGPLIGRGPAPFSDRTTTGSALSPRETWMRTPPPLDEEPLALDEKSHITLTSGASLLEASRNPLELPGHGSQYSSERHVRESSGSISRGSSPTFPAVHIASHTQDSGFMASEPEVLVGADGSLPVSSPKGQDEWEGFRRQGGDKGWGAAVGYQAGPGTVERKLDETFEGSGEDVESEEAARLREWAMSAQAASKNVHR